MPWQTDMLPGRLNGIPIWITQRQLRGGRQTSLHEFVGTDALGREAEAWSEDTGKLPRRFSLQFVTIGDDYMIDRDRVLEVLERPGPYTYTDPTFGDIQVALDGPYQLDEAFDGVADFQLTFHRAGTLEFPIITDPSGAVKNHSALALAKIPKGLSKRFTLGKLINLILGGMGKAVTALAIAKSKISSKLGVIDKFTQALNQLQMNISDLAGTPEDFANAFKHLAAQTVALVQEWLDSHIPPVLDGRGHGSGDGPGIQVLVETATDFRAFDGGSGDSDITTPDGELEHENLLAIEAMVGQTMFALVAAQMVELEPETAASAEDAKEQMIAWADDLLADPGIDSEVYEAIADLAAALVNYLVTVGQNLPNERIFVARAPMPACVVSQIVYGTGAFDDEITRRNNIRHPLFASGEIKVTGG